ncbi:MAG: ABC transporter ATP-binding protein [Actinobacteria bacterium]|nr:ABC transporter ATP-binding protein [Actinomycetota bacterium]MCL6104782.1 ABC transporter ATP-binding protein [Actinomycetota bacterium]
MNSDVTIEISNLSKRFRLYHEKYTSFRERFVHAGKIPYEEFWALKDIDIQVKTGETLGLLGRNGSGKTTLLKCMASILLPTTGEIAIRGKVAALLELGAGFQPELSGRDNIFLNGSLLGLSRKEIVKRFDEIVAFSELEQFIDNQVKYYSSGMYMRLGFAVAVHVEPELLLIDEVLAVGDESFQLKCLSKIEQFQKEGRTIVFVTHAPDLAKKICNRAVILEHGTVAIDDDISQATKVFRKDILHTKEADED